MSLGQSATPILLPSADEVKTRIVTNAEATTTFLARVESLIERHEALLAYLRRTVEDRRDAIQEERPLVRVIKEFLGAVSPKESLLAQSLTESGLTASRELESIQAALRVQDYSAIEKRTQVHYDDLKDLTILEVNGDTEADAFHQRAINAISALRQVQREVEETSYSRHEIVALAGELTDQ